MRFLLVKSIVESDEKPGIQTIVGIAVGSIEDSAGIYHHIAPGPRGEFFVGAVELPDSSTWSIYDHNERQAVVKFDMDGINGPKIRSGSVFINTGFEADEVYDIYNEAQILKISMDERSANKAFRNWVLNNFNCYVFLKRTISSDGKRVKSEPFVTYCRDNGKSYKTMLLYTSQDIEPEYMQAEYFERLVNNDFQLYILDPIDMVKLAVQNSVTHFLINDGNVCDVYLPNIKSIEPFLDEALQCDSDMRNVFHTAEVNGELENMPSAYQRAYHKATLTSY